MSFYLRYHNGSLMNSRENQSVSKANSIVEKCQEYSE